MPAHAIHTVYSGVWQRRRDLNAIQTNREPASGVGGQHVRIMGSGAYVKVGVGWRKKKRKEEKRTRRKRSAIIICSRAKSRKMTITNAGLPRYTVLPEVRDVFNSDVIFYFFAV